MTDGTLPAPASRRRATDPRVHPSFWAGARAERERARNEALDAVPARQEEAMHHAMVAHRYDRLERSRSRECVDPGPRHRR